MKKPNLLILGASGGVANALLHFLVHHRNFFDKLILLDKNKKILSDIYIDHKSLNYIFVNKRIILPAKEKEYHSILKKYKINIVLDITDDSSIPLLESTNKAKVSYVNTGMNDSKKVICDLIFEVWRKRSSLKNAPHILCSGMNPGVVNMWASYGIEQFGIPKQIILFEYDTACISDGWRPSVTWSIKEFLEEVVRDPSAIMLGRFKTKELLPNALENREKMDSILKPIMKLDKYPEGFIVSHEETSSLAQKYDIPAKYVYAINIGTMKTLIKLYEKNKIIRHSELILADNTCRILEGADNIGMILDYKDKMVYYFNSIPNNSVIGSNATYTQVAIGILSALFTLVFDKLNPGIYFVEDLFKTGYKYYLFDNMRVHEYIFKKEKNRLKLLKHVPEIRLNRKKKLEYLYI